MYTYPYQILKQHLSAKVPQLRKIDWYLEQYSKGLVTTEPALFLEFRPIGMEQLSFGVQMAEVEILAHLVSTNMKDNDVRIKKTDARDHASLVDSIYKALNGFSASLSYLTAYATLANTDKDRKILNSMVRNEIPAPPHKIKSLELTIQRFTSVMFDYSAVKGLTAKPVPAVITPGFG